MDVAVFAADDAEAINIWWLGQSGFALSGAGTRLLIDPYLSDSLARKYRGTMFTHQRLMPPPVGPESLSGIDLALCTHAHSDHMDPDTLAPLVANNPAMRVVAPRAVMEIARQRGVPGDRLIGLDAGEVARWDAITITAIAAAHEERETDEAGRHLYLGYVIEWNGVVLYHSGDCVPYPGLIDVLRGFSPSIGLLPVNGRDARRLAHGIPGNFTPEEALAICRASGIPVLVAQHFGMFDCNTVSGEDLKRRLGGCTKTQVIIPQINTAYRLSRSQSTSEAIP